jgi:hypothetical protein
MSASREHRRWQDHRVLCGDLCNKLVAGAAALALGWGSIGAFLLMVTGILIIMADAHVDPLAIITEDALHPEGIEIDQPPGTGTGSPVT